MPALSSALGQQTGDRWPEDSGPGAGWPDDGFGEAWPDGRPADDGWPGEDAWLADVCGRDREASQSGPRSAPVPETLPAGFADRAAAGGGPGFAAGGPADHLGPGPVLAGLVAEAWRGGLAALDDDELIGVLLAARKLSSWQAAVELQAVAELDRRRVTAAADSRAAAGPRAAAHTSEELAAALTLTGRAADILVGTAEGLTRLPAVLAALAEGLIDRFRAVVFADELVLLDPGTAAAVADAVVPRAGGLTTGQLRATLRRAVLAVDPQAARRRSEHARADARVQSWAEASGNAALAGRELPPAKVLAADRHLTALARTLHTAGAPGTLDQLRAQIYLALLSGRSPRDLLCPPGRSPRDLLCPPGPARDDASAGCQDPGGPGSGGPGSGGPRPGGACSGDPDAGGTGGLTWPSGPRGTIHLTLPLSAWLGLSDAPGQVAGHGPISADDGRDLAASLASRPGPGSVRWAVTLTTRDGHPLAHARPVTGPPGPGPPRRGQSCTAAAAWLRRLPFAWLDLGRCAHQRQTAGYRPAAELRALVKIRHQVCGFPGCRQPAGRCDDDHTIPYEQGGRTCECNLAPLCRRHHRAKQTRGWQLAQPQPGILVWSLPHRRSYPARPEPYPV
jgi:hypothetical protein